MEIVPKYVHEPEVLAKILASLPPIKTNSEKMTVDDVADIFCDLPDVVGIKVGMSTDAAMEILKQESKIAYIDFGQTFHDQIESSENRINFLKQEIAKEKELILKVKSELKVLLSNSAKKLERRRPPKSTEHKVATKHLLKKWILALQTELRVSTRAAMEAMINSYQDDIRNLLLWRDGTRTPSPDSLLRLLSLKIITGKHEGKTLANIPLPQGAPMAHNIFKLICRGKIDDNKIITFFGDSEEASNSE